MNTSFSSYRIGNRASALNDLAATSESSILRSLFMLRTKYDDETIQHLIFRNCSWSPRILQSLRKVLVRDGRQFASIKFFDCAINSDASNSKFFAEILSTILINNSTTSLVIQGGKLIGSSSQDQHEEYSCELSCSRATIALALQEGLLINKSLTSMTLSEFLDDQSLAQFLQSVKEHPSLTKLNLSKNYLGARTSNAASSSTIALDALVDLLQSRKSKLESLNLSNQYQYNLMTTITQQSQSATSEEQRIQKHQAAFGRALVALSANTSLRQVDLSGNYGCFSEIQSVEVLTSCLTNNSCLECIDVSGCGLTSGSISYLARECIPKCGASLKSLVLFATNDLKSSSNSTEPTSCHVECYRAAALALENELMSSNSTLEYLGELSNETHDEFARLQQALNLNKGGRRAFGQSTLPCAAWSHLLARAGAIDYNIIEEESKAASASVMFALLRQGSILMEQ